MVDPEIWLRNAGQSKKGRVYGTRKSLDLTIGDSTHGSSSTVIGPSPVHSTHSTKDIDAIAT